MIRLFELIIKLNTMEENIKSHEDLEVWQQCRILRTRVWHLCKTFPSDEKYRLCDQLIRASRSATANIAEGYGRFFYQENIQFCRTARGSVNEMIDHFSVAHDCEYIDMKTKEEFISMTKSCLRLINGYINYLRKAKTGQ